MTLRMNDAENGVCMELSLNSEKTAVTVKNGRNAFLMTQGMTEGENWEWKKKRVERRNA